MQLHQENVAWVSSHTPELASPAGHRPVLAHSGQPGSEQAPKCPDPAGLSRLSLGALDGWTDRPPLCLTQTSCQRLSADACHVD